MKLKLLAGAGITIALGLTTACSDGAAVEGDGFRMVEAAGDDRTKAASVGAAPAHADAPMDAGPAHRGADATGVEAAPGPEPSAEPTPSEDQLMTSTNQFAMFGAGCFWGVELRFQTTEGVVDTEVGYSGGSVENPNYYQVCSDTTGHAEVVRVEFDPSTISYAELLDVFWDAHDPTQVNRQGPDRGSQYRTAIFYYGDEQRETAEQSKAALEASGKHRRPIATEISAAREFYPAEAYHQDYLKKRGVTSCGVGGH